MTSVAAPAAPSSGPLPDSATSGTVDPGAAAGRNELGTVTIADKVVERVAAMAASEHPDAGRPATRVLGRTVPGAGSDLDRLPRTSVEVDGSRAFVRLTLAVRWPASINATTQAVRAHVRDRVRALTGVQVDEVHIAVSDLVTDIAAAPRVR